jgi:hypothetical protein
MTSRTASPASYREPPPARRRLPIPARNDTAGTTRIPIWRIATIAVPLAIVLVNFAVTCVAPVTAFPWDDLFLFDGVWHVAQGQIAGVDFYNPMGFGPFHIAAALWRMVGPTHAALPFAIAAISATVSLCTSGVILRRPLLHGFPGLLLCVVIAFEASAPSVYGWPFWAIGISAFYNRLTTAAIAVLMLQWFTVPETRSRRVNLEEIVLSAVLLNVLFLVKISALILGIGVIGAAMLTRSDWKQTVTARLVPIGLLLTLFLIADFVLSGVPLEAVIGLYQRAARVRASLAGFDALPRAMGSWITFIALPILAVQAFGLARDGISVWRLFVLVGGYLAFQTALNISNTQPGTAFLAPACATILFCWHRETSGAAGRAMSASATRIASFLVVVPDALGTVFAAGLTIASAVGLVTPVVISGGTGLSLPVFRDFRGGEKTIVHADAVNHGILDLQELGLDRLRIASLDYDNPFPSMLTAPSARRVDVVLAPGYMEPGDKLLDPDEIIGDACVLMVPKRPAPVIEDSAEFLTASVAPALTTLFHLVRRDALWEIYRRVDACPD